MSKKNNHSTRRYSSLQLAILLICHRIVSCRRGNDARYLGESIPFFVISFGIFVIFVMANS